MFILIHGFVDHDYDADATLQGYLPKEGLRLDRQVGIGATMLLSTTLYLYNALRESRTSTQYRQTGVLLDCKQRVRGVEQCPHVILSITPRVQFVCPLAAPTN
jgi:hypothetical protein